MKKCPKCRGDLRIKDVEYRGTVKGDSIHTTIQNYVCSRCGYRFTDEEMEHANINKLYSIYKTKNRLLQSHEIVKIRKDLGWTQERLANYLGLNVEDVNYFEHGAIQLRLHDQHIRDLGLKKNLKGRYKVVFEGE